MKKKLNNDLSMFVDIMYYDFVLYKVVEIFRGGISGDTKHGDEYFEIGKKLYKKFQNHNIVLDNQIALKIMYIKFKRMLMLENCPGNTSPLCCDHHISIVLQKGFDTLENMKIDHPSVLESKIFNDLNILIASLIFIYCREYSKNSANKDLMISVHSYLKSHKIEINTTEGFDRLKASLFERLGVKNEKNFSEYILMSIENMLEKTFRMFKEPFLYTLSVEKVNSILIKHEKMFKEEKEILKPKFGDVFEPKSPGEKVKWEEK